MAKTAVNIRVTDSSSYTVPANKQFIGQATFIGGSSGGGSGCSLIVNGVTIKSFSLNTSGGFSNTTLELKPLTGNAGDVFSTSSTGIYSLTGFLFDPS
jgi:hypothetical protein